MELRNKGILFQATKVTSRETENGDITKLSRKRDIQNSTMELSSHVLNQR